MKKMLSVALLLSLNVSFAKVSTSMSLDSDSANIGKATLLTIEVQNEETDLIDNLKVLTRGAGCGRAPYGLVFDENVLVQFSNENTKASGECKISNWYSSYGLNCNISNLAKNEAVKIQLKIIPSEKNKSNEYTLSTCTSENSEAWDKDNNILLKVN